MAYSRVVRAFHQSDEPLTRLYNAYPAIYEGGTMPPQLGSEDYPDGADYPFAVVPENLTEIDRLKIGIDLTEARQLVRPSLLRQYGEPGPGHRTRLWRVRPAADRSDLSRT